MQLQYGNEEMKEEDFRKRVIYDLEKRELLPLSMGRGTFDIYEVNSKKFIELKRLVDLSRVPKTKEDEGIKFTEAQSTILKKLKNVKDLPTVLVEDGDMFFIIPRRTAKAHTST